MIVHSKVSQKNGKSLDQLPSSKKLYCRQMNKDRDFDLSSTSWAFKLFVRFYDDFFTIDWGKRRKISGRNGAKLLSARVRMKYTITVKSRSQWDTEKATVRSIVYGWLQTAGYLEQSLPKRLSHPELLQDVVEFSSLPIVVFTASKFWRRRLSPSSAKFKLLPLHRETISPLSLRAVWAEF